MIRVAPHHASVHVHIRGGMAGLGVIAGAALTGAPLHIVHISPAWPDARDAGDLRRGRTGST
jgi:hypothetical protein